MTIDQLRQMIRTLGKDGSISISNRQILEREAYKMGISDDDLQHIIDDELNKNTTSSTVASSSTQSRPGISIKLSSKRVEKPNTWNPLTDEFSRTPDEPKQSEQQTEHPQPEPTIQQATQPKQPPQPDVQQTSQSDVQQTSPQDVVSTSNSEDDDKDKKMRRMKVMLIIAGVLLLGLLSFLIIERNAASNSVANDCNGNDGSTTRDTTVANNPVADTTRNNNPVADTTRNNNPVADTTHNNNPVADTTHRDSPVADSSAVNNNGGGDNTTSPQHTVLDVDRYAAKLLEKQGDRCKANNDIEKARRLYDSAYRKDPDNRDIKRKLDECNQLLNQR